MHQRYQIDLNAHREDEATTSPVKAPGKPGVFSSLFTRQK